MWRSSNCNYKVSVILTFTLKKKCKAVNELTHGYKYYMNTIVQILFTINKLNLPVAYIFLVSIVSHTTTFSQEFVYLVLFLVWSYPTGASEETVWDVICGWHEFPKIEINIGFAIVFSKSKGIWIVDLFSKPI